MTRAFGRTVGHDSQSRSFAHPGPVELATKTALSAHHAPVLNQGEPGPARGASAQCLNVDYFAAVLPKVTKVQPPLEHDADTFYEIGTRLDGVTDNTYFSNRRWQLQPRLPSRVTKSSSCSASARSRSMRPELCSSFVDDVAPGSRTRHTEPDLGVPGISWATTIEVPTSLGQVSGGSR
jgi:hypothetical protein